MVERAFVSPPLYISLLTIKSLEFELYPAFLAVFIDLKCQKKKRRVFPESKCDSEGLVLLYG